MFALCDRAMEILTTITRDKLNNEDSKFFYPPNDIRSKYIFPSKDYGRVLANKEKGKTPYVVDVRKTWWKVLSLAGVDRKLKHYATRHTLASNLLPNSNVKVVSETLGVSIKQASKYAKVQQKHVVESLNKVFEKKQKVKLKAAN